MIDSIKEFTSENFLDRVMEASSDMDLFCERSSFISMSSIRSSSSLIWSLSRKFSFLSSRSLIS